MNVTRISFIFLFIALYQFVRGQTIDTTKQAFSIGLEIRPRIEYYRDFTNGTFDPQKLYMYTTQRNRLSMDYRIKRFKFHGSLQEIRLWSVDQKFSKVGSINAFELFAEAKLVKDLSVRVGRQALSLDNGRIFSAAPWGQQSRAHEGIRLLYRKDIITDFMFAFTRPYPTGFDPAYSPVASHQYKFLLAHHLKKKIGKYFTVTTINALDAFKNGLDGKKYHSRITNGGRIEWSDGPFYATVSGYYQHGRTKIIPKIRSYYIQPEVAYTVGQTLVRLGAEWLSGDAGGTTDQTSNSFVPLYGVAWKFMGNMNFFAKFPTDVQGKGLINPYLFVLHPLNNKISLRLDSHLFYSQYPLMDNNGYFQSTYLGFEADGAFNYKPTSSLEIILGLSVMFPEKGMTVLQKVKSDKDVPIWSYLMVSYQPKLFDRRW